MKAILVINMPKSCYKCPLMFDDGNGIWCGAERDKDGDMHMRVHYYCDENGRASWCPLKPMPERVTENVMKGMPNEDWQQLYDEGWNDCIKEIEK